MSPIRRDGAETPSLDAMDRCGKSSLTSMRQQCAHRLQQRLQDPRLRAEKASQVLAGAPHAAPPAVAQAVPPRGSHLVQNKVGSRSGTPARSRQPCRSASVSSQVGRSRPQSAGPIRRVGNTARQEAAADLLRQQRPQCLGNSRPAAPRSTEKQVSRPLSARSVGASSRAAAGDPSKRMPSVERSRMPRSVAEGRNLPERQLNTGVAGAPEISSWSWSHGPGMVDLPDKLYGVNNAEAAAPSVLGVPAAVCAAEAAVSSLSKLVNPPGHAGQGQVFDDTTATTAVPAAYLGNAAQHYCIADAQASPYFPPDQQVRQFSEVAKSLESAAKALREMSRTPAANPVDVSNSAVYFQDSQPLVSNLQSPPAASPRPGRRGALTPRSSTPRRHPRTSPCATTRPELQASPVPNSAERLLTQENATLRTALGDAVRRIVELEGEQEQFMSEGAFDLVNSLCRTGEPEKLLNMEEKLLCSPPLSGVGVDGAWLQQIA